MPNKFFNKKNVVQFLIFVANSLVNNLVHLGVYYLLTYIKLHYIPSYIIAFAVSVLNAYILNSRIAFRREKKSKTAIIKTYVSYTITLGIALGLLWLQTEQLGVSENIAPLFNMFVTIPCNFLLNKFWVYSGNGKTADGETTVTEKAAPPPETEAEQEEKEHTD